MPTGEFDLSTLSPERRQFFTQSQEGTLFKLPTGLYVKQAGRMVPSVAPATPPVQGSIPQRFLQGIGKFLANPPGWEGEKAGIASTAQGVMQLPQFVAGARQQIPADVEALVTQPGKAIPEQMVRAGKMAWGMVPFHETMEEAASGKRPSLDTLYKGGTELALSQALLAAGGRLVKGVARGLTKNLPGAGVALQEAAIPRAESITAGIRAGGTQDFLSRTMGEEATTVARGEQIQQGLKDMARDHRVGEAVEWEFPKAEETGVPDFWIDNLREHMRARVAERQDLQQAVSPSTSSRLSSGGGQHIPGAKNPKVRKSTEGPEGWPEPPEGTELSDTTYHFDPNEKLPSGVPPPGGVFVTERATRSGMTSEQLMRGLAQGEGPITLRQAMTLRKSLGEMYESGDQAPLAAFRADMEADAEFNPQRAEAWQAARNYTRENIVPFRSNQPLGRLIDKGEPTAVMDALLRPDDKGITNLRAIAKQTQGQGPTWEAVRQEALERITKDPKTYYGMGPETRNLLFRADEEMALRRTIATNALDEQIGKGVGRAGESFSSFSVNRVTKWIEQQERAVRIGRPTPEAQVFVGSFSPGELADIKGTLKDISRNMAALPTMRGAAVGSSQRAVQFAVGEPLGAGIGYLTGYPWIGASVGPAAAMGMHDLISKALQTATGRAFIRRAIRMSPVTSPQFNTALGAFLRSQEGGEGQGGAPSAFPPFPQTP